MVSIKYVSEDWCAPCKAFWPVVNEVCQSRNVPVNKINTGDPQIADLSISSIPTLLYYKNGNLVTKTKGVMSKQQFESFLKSI